MLAISKRYMNLVIYSKSSDIENMISIIINGHVGGACEAKTTCSEFGLHQISRIGIGAFARRWHAIRWSRKAIRLQWATIPSSVSFIRQSILLFDINCHYLA